MRLGETLQGLLLESKPIPLNGTFTFLVTECTEYEGKRLYATYEREVPEEHFKFRKTRAGRYRMTILGDPFFDLRNKLTAFVCEDIFVYPRFEELYCELGEGSSVR